MAERAHPVPSILVVAGEVSGDMHAAGVIRALKARMPEVEVWGVGGDLLEAEGAEIHYHVRDMAALGLTEVLKKYGFFRRVFHELLGMARERQPDLVLLVDYPGFNLRFARRTHESGLKVVYYICPQVWAWKKGRIDKIAAWVDRLMVIFPFEVDLFEGKPLQVDYVGHPLVGETRRALDAPPQELPWPEGQVRVALLPGSRVQEIRRILPLLLACAARLREEEKACFLIAAASEQIAGHIREGMEAFEGSTEGVGVVTGQTREILRQSQAAIVASGTATLETALMGCPMVIVYITAGLTWEVGRRVVKLKHIGMINVLAGREVCPEFLQDQATEQNVCQALVPLLQKASQYHEMKAGMEGTLASLGGLSGGETAASILYDELCPS